ncbi:MAG: peptidoglycan-binding protein [Hyphomicrobium zavarzinii]|jgi:peptidoglycan hydrolase-like protein with peptidoglycan-binding domain|uniref:peptidoglycan-binding domain-containing protein n=1 Tax=Hyphomicrobium TaxID=81 RepID=UPI0003745957|nr:MULTISPECIES: peptidoglycan-binding domain-containing protein [Hyphomicrobium]MBL8846551.1 peptidoglycan-binding protein [Hyphomicrobium zavarzinii]WBT36691.1 peptidoglycan-binding domain-containing protein [Hyphomicrobium sp. DMF-1]HML44129.1 peptidoglycan-binding domain-containing protein [Hyphomicrobium zavarzinii]
MTPFAVRLTLLTFAVLSGAMATNIFVFQPPGRQIAGIDAARQGTSVGDGWSSQPPAISGLSRPDAAAGERGATVPPIETGAVKPIPETVDRSDLTRAIQRELKAKGYEAGAVDGVIGLVTRGAIMAYESDAGLPLTGEPRQALLQHIVLGSAELQAADTGKSPPGPEAEAVIRAVQRAFRQLGYISTLPDGRLNDQTRRAIRKFEVDRKMSETGRISGELLAKLATLAGDALRATQ